MTKNMFDLYGLAEKNTMGADTESISELFEQESRRYSRELNEEEEARLK